jgi:hypothetical protein
MSSKADQVSKPDFLCILGKRQFQVFSQAITASGRIGRELLIHADEKILKLRCFSDTKQAFIAFDFERSFFERYQVRGDDGSIKCKVPLKCCSMALRSTSKVEQMVLTLHSNIDHTICFQFRGQHSIIKTCTFFYSESDVFNVNFDKDATTHQISARTGMLSDLLSHIRGTDEMTLEVDASKEIVKISSFHPSLEDTAVYKTLKTELSVNFADFDETELQQSSNLTFNLTEFKTLITFCTSKAVDIESLTLFFSNGGQPICVQTSTSPGSSLLYRSEIVMATAQFVDASSVTANVNNYTETPYFREDDEDTKVGSIMMSGNSSNNAAMPPVPSNSSFDSSSQFTGGLQNENDLSPTMPGF